MNPARRLASAYEGFYYIPLGEASIEKRGRPNTFLYPAPAGNARTHPTERPVLLMADILQVFLNPGQRVLVPFAGSGSTILAACNMYMEARGFDLAEPYKSAFDYRVLTGEFRKYV